LVLAREAGVAGGYAKLRLLLMYGLIGFFGFPGWSGPVRGMDCGAAIAFIGFF